MYDTGRNSYLSFFETSEQFKVFSSSNQYKIFIFTGGKGYFKYQNLIHDFYDYGCMLVHGPLELSFFPGLHNSYSFIHLSFGIEDILSSSFPSAALGIIDDYLNTPQTAAYFSLKSTDYESALHYSHIINDLQKDVLSHSLHLLQHTLSSFVFHLARSYFFSGGNKRQGKREFSSRTLMLEHVKQYVQQHFSDPLSLSSIADYVFTNSSYLSRIFKEEYGIPLSSYINQVRIAAAKKLLLDTDDLIIDIALACGYNYIPHFNRIFKEFVNMSPTQYRKQHKPQRHLNLKEL